MCEVGYPFLAIHWSLTVLHQPWQTYGTRKCGTKPGLQMVKVCEEKVKKVQEWLILIKYLRSTNKSSVKKKWRGLHNLKQTNTRIFIYRIYHQGWNAICTKRVKNNLIAITFPNGNKSLGCLDFQQVNPKNALLSYSQVMSQLDWCLKDWENNLLNSGK